MAKETSAYDQRRLYGDLAWTWPIISPPEDYFEEAAAFWRAISERTRIEVHTLLDLGCGGGHNDYHLKRHAQVTGVDLSKPMLALARQLNPKATYLTGDMRTVRLGQVFDAVIIADSINHMLNLQDLRAAFATARAHLRPGGVFCTYAERTAERFRQNETHCSTYARGNVEIAFLENVYDRDRADTTYESTFVFLIRRDGRLQVETDRHLGGIFPLEVWPALLRQVGFEVWPAEFVEDGERVPMFACTA